MASKLGARFVPGRGEYEVAESRGEKEILLVKPMTYMNNSGVAFRDVLERYPVALSETLTIVDDFDLPLGTIRMRRSGSAGTHNGLASIVWTLQSEDFPRLRCGIGSPHKPADKRLTADFVLAPFARDERRTVEEMIGRACQAGMIFAEENYHKAVEAISTTRK
jgi:PTH1 family peptidyl-tRNA hydrolase